MRKIVCVSSISVALVGTMVLSISSSSVAHSAPTATASPSASASPSTSATSSATSAKAKATPKSTPTPTATATPTPTSTVKPKASPTPTALTPVAKAATPSPTPTSKTAAAPANAPSPTAKPTPAALTYSVGSTGPGGGKVFYVSQAGFTCGINLDQICHYLEAPPLTGTNSWADVSTYWSPITSGTAGSNQSLGNFPVIANNSAIGHGCANTQYWGLLNLDDRTGQTYAPYVLTVMNYKGPNNVAGWCLPSVNELLAMQSQATLIGGLKFNRNYWSSTTDAGTLNAEALYAGLGMNLGSPIAGINLIRPVRAF